MTEPRAMKALMYDGRMLMTDVPVPEPKTGEALVRVLIAGICKTDVEISKGYMNFRGIPGHEFVGIVQDSPDADQVGARVVGEINAGCGGCPLCAAGMQRHCSSRTVLGIDGRDGAFAEYLTLPASNLIPVPARLTNSKAVFAEPLAAALEILEQVPVQPGYRVLVIGDGKLGLLACSVLKLTGCDLVLVGKHREKMKIFGATGGTTVSLDRLSEISEPFDVVVEASGHTSGFEYAMRHLRPRGTLVLKSTYQGDLTLNAAPIVINEVSVVGSRCGKFEPALRLLAQGLIDPTPLIDTAFPFDQAEQAFRRSQETGALKVLLEF
jgi:threonine dehydrogenase-like Zn-dependent dehydrogenase